METLLSALRSGRTLCRFSDQHSTPLYTGQVSRLLLRLIERGALGLLHLGAKEKTSRFQFACMVADIFACAQAAIHAAPFRHIEGIARRPRDSSLVSARAEERWGIEAPDLRAGLQEFKSDWETAERTQADD
jgi:dTDP-4-dehydrorhamnose reductase